MNKTDENADKFEEKEEKHEIKNKKDDSEFLQNIEGDVEKDLKIPAKSSKEEEDQAVEIEEKIEGELEKKIEEESQLYVPKEIISCKYFEMFYLILFKWVEKNQMTLKKKKKSMMRQKI